MTQTHCRILSDVGRKTRSNDRGLKRSRFKVLKNLGCPGMLVELGFISHKNTAQLLRQSQYREKLAISLAKKSSSTALPKTPRRKGVNFWKQLLLVGTGGFLELYLGGY